MKGLVPVVTALTVLGALNLGLVGLGGLLGKNLDLLNMLLGGMPMVQNVVYLLVGVSALLVGKAHMTKQCHV